jgi:hypothetical protein
VIVAVPVAVMAAQGSMDGALIAGVVAGVPASIAFVYVLMGIMFGNAELVHDPKVGALAALKSSWRMAAGHRWAMLGCWVVFAGVMLAGLLACLVGIIFAIGFASVMFASLFLALKNGQTQDA